MSAETISERQFNLLRRLSRSDFVQMRTGPEKHTARSLMRRKYAEAASPDMWTVRITDFGRAAYSDFSNERQ